MTGSPHILAIILSLPLALTLWGMLWFTISVVSSAYFANLPAANISYQNVLRITSISIVCALVGVVMIVAWFFRAQRSGNLRRTLQMRRSTTEHQAAPSPRGLPDMIQMTRMNSSSPSTLLDDSYRASPVRQDVYHPYSASPLDFSFVPSPHSFVQGIDADVGWGSSPYGLLATPVSGAIYHPPSATSRRFASTASSVARDVYHRTYRPYDVESRTTRVPYHPPSGSDLALPTFIPTMYSTPSLQSLPPSYSSTNIASQPIFPPPTVAQAPHEPVISMVSRAGVPARFSPDTYPFIHETPASLPLPSMAATPKDQPPNYSTDRLYPPRIVLHPNEPYGPKLGTPTYRPSLLGPNRQPLPIPVSLPHYPLAAATSWPPPI
jgi:hypothetical protein